MTGEYHLLVYDRNYHLLLLHVSRSVFCHSHLRDLKGRFLIHAPKSTPLTCPLPLFLERKETKSCFHLLWALNRHLHLQVHLALVLWNYHPRPTHSVWSSLIELEQLQSAVVLILLLWFLSFLSVIEGFGTCYQESYSICWHDFAGNLIGHYYSNYTSMTNYRFHCCRSCDWYPN